MWALTLEDTDIVGGLVPSGFDTRMVNISDIN